MSDIQVRNRYKKECDILIQRLEILQQQEKSYTDLTERIEEKKLALNELEEKEKILKQNIKKETLALNDLRASFIKKTTEYTNLEKKALKTQENIEINNNKYKQNTLTFNKEIEYLKNTIIDLKWQKEVYKKREQQLDLDLKIYTGNIKKEKQKVFDEVKANDEKLIKQREEKKQLTRDITKLKSDYNELDKEYQNLLETYILKQ